jgi:hypothetical protein
MCQVLAGRAPYALDAATCSAFELACAICDAEPLVLSEAAALADTASSPPAVPPRALRGDLDAAVAKALRKDPAALPRIGRADGRRPVPPPRSGCRCMPAAARSATAWAAGSCATARGRRGHRRQPRAAGRPGAGVGPAHEARLQRAHAEQASARVRALANLAMFDVHDEVAKLPGSIQVRKQLVERAQAYLAALETDVSNDPGLGLDLARSYRRLGDIQGRPSWENLGDFDGALASYERSAVQKAAADRPWFADQRRVDLSAWLPWAARPLAPPPRALARATAGQALAARRGMAQEPDTGRCCCNNAHGLLS